MKGGESCYSFTLPIRLAPSSLASDLALQQTGLVQVQGCWCSMHVYDGARLGAAPFYFTPICKTFKKNQ